MEPARHSRVPVSSSGQADNTETWEETKEKFLHVTPDELARKGSRCQTYKKNTEANTKVYDFNQSTMQVLDILAAVNASFGQAWCQLGG